MCFYTVNAQDCFLNVWVKTNAPQSAIMGVVLDANNSSWLKVSIKALPVEGTANAILIGYLADILNIPQKQISIIQGKTSKYKRIYIQDNSADLVTKLNNLRLVD